EERRDRLVVLRLALPVRKPGMAWGVGEQGPDVATGADARAQDMSVADLGAPEHGIELGLRITKAPHGGGYGNLQVRGRGLGHRPLLPRRRLAPAPRA